MAANQQRRVALVTGGARGIGRGIALDLARTGCDVALCYRTSRADAEATVTALQAFGARALALPADVGDADQAQALFDRVTAELGAPAILVHAAGPYHRTALGAETPDGWRAMLAGNLDSLFYCARLAAPAMIARGWGRILAFGMANADRAVAFPSVAAHYVAKVGVLALVRAWARTLAPHGITVNAISPGYIDTGSTPDETAAALPRIPAGRLGTVDDVVAVAGLLLSEAAGYTTGANVIVSGGWGL
jgi:3-oxoacyl-[acyl-carrier protein] reductase